MGLLASLIAVFESFAIYENFVRTAGKSNYNTNGTIAMLLLDDTFFSSWAIILKSK